MADSPTLADLIARRQSLNLHCRCTPAIRMIDPRHLADRHGDGMTLAALQPRLRCRACGQRGAAVIEVKENWNPNLLAMQTGVVYGTVSAEHLQATRARDHARRRGRRRRVVSALRQGGATVKEGD